MTLWHIDNLTVQYQNSGKPALQDFTCHISQGDTVGIIGQSGAGKTTLAMALLGLLNTTAVCQSATFTYKGQPLSHTASSAWQDLRGKEIALIPQASQNAWNPVLTIGHQLVEHIRCHSRLSLPEAITLATAKLLDVGLPKQLLTSYPHQLSGGMRQRAAIAMACSLQPSCLIADECTHALDAENEQTVISLLRTLQQQHNMALIVISHDLTVIARLCHKLIVLQGGKIVETGQTAAILQTPVHPYTKELVSAASKLNPALTSREVLP